MLRALGLKSAKDESANLSAEQKVSQVLQQAHDFEICLTAMDYVLDDRADEGLKLIETKNEAIYKLATGVVRFIEFTLGFEAETREKAQSTLAEAESLSLKAKLFNERNNLKTSSIYPPGTEYAVTLAESTLLNALCMLLSESMLESAKALYKLRKAYHILDDISRKIQANQDQNQKKFLDSSSVLSSSSVSLSSTTTATTNSISNKFIDVPLPLSEQQKKDAKIIKNCEKIFAMRSSRFDGSNIGNESANTRLRADLGLKSKLLGPANESQTSFQSTINDVNTSTIDEFIQSGVHLCFGILQVVLSLIPPAIGKVLSIVGFKGSREAGLKMLWKAAELRNIHGSLGLLALLVFYDGPLQFTDVDFDVPAAVPQEPLQHQVSRQSSKLSLMKTMSRKKMDVESKAATGTGAPTLLHPGRRLEVALLNARATFPHSALWLLQEGKMLASHGRLKEAIELMDSLPADKIHMVQVEALLVFDRAFLLVFLHQYERAAKEFQRLVEINAWSHSLYIYLCGACYLECWRMCETGLFIKTGKDDIDPTKKDWYLEQAGKFLLESTDYIGKKKLQAKTMPFDKFTARKIGSIKQTSKSRNLSIPDSVSTSLIHEAIYFWNGYNRLPAEHLELTLKLLGFSADKDSKYALTKEGSGASYSKLEKESIDEKSIRLLLQSISLRRLGKLEEGEALLDEVVSRIVTPDGKFNKLNNDPWLYPSALYEKALFVWKRTGVDQLEEVKGWLKKAMAYGGDDYELSTRIGMKIKAAIDRLDEL